MSTEICTACGTEFEPADRFCRECGARRSPDACLSCGTALQANARFCIQCGTQVTGAPPAAEAPRKGTGELGDRRIVTVMFTEVMGLAALNDKLDPEEISDIANQFFSLLTEPVYRYGGMVDKYIGDSVVMSLFGVPTVRPDDPVRGVRAAWAMVDAAKKFADALEPRIGSRLNLRCGLNTGVVVAGEVGGAQKRDYTVMGDTVNLAQRMEANAPAGGILVASETYHNTKDHFDYRILEPIKVKGKEHPVAVFEVLGPKDAAMLPGESQPASAN